MSNHLINFFNKNRPIVGILFAGLILRLIYFLIILRNFGDGGFYLTSNGDAVEYLGLAKQWLARHTFYNLQNSVQPEIFRMPGYPLFISFFYKLMPSIALPILFQNFVFLIFIFLFYKFCAALLESRRTALMASSFLAFEPSIIYWNNQLLTESFFAVLIFSAVYCAFIFSSRKKIGYSALAGLFFALATFTRPAGEYLSAVFLVFWGILFFTKKISWQKFILAVSVFLAVFILVLGPWLLRNKAVFGVYGISNSSVNGFGKYLSVIDNETGEKSPPLDNKNPLRGAMVLQREAVYAISGHPVIFLKTYILSLAPFLFGDAYLSVFGRVAPSLEKARVATNWKGAASEFLNFFKGHGGTEALIFFGGKIVWASIIISAILGLACWILKYKKQYPMLVFLLLIIFYFSLASGIGAYSRFRFPVNPYIFILAAMGIEWAIELKRKK